MISMEIMKTHLKSIEKVEIFNNYWKIFNYELLMVEIEKKLSAENYFRSYFF